MRALVALPLPDGVDCAALAEKNFHFIYTSFNTRTSLTEEEWEQYGFKGWSALRMLHWHWHFASSMDFRDFQKSHMDKYNWKFAKDPIHLALCTIAADLRGTVDAPAVLTEGKEGGNSASMMVVRTRGVFGLNSPKGVGLSTTDELPLPRIFIHRDLCGCAQAANRHHINVYL